MKTIFAIAAATATVLAGGSAFAAERLNDTQMDTVSAAGFTLDLSQNNVAYVEPLQAVEVKTISYASKGGEVENKISVSQNTWISQKNTRFVIIK